MKEIGYMTDILNLRGLKEGDHIIVRPFGQRTKKFSLKYTKILLTTDKDKKGGWIKTFESVQGEKFTYELEKVLVPSLNQQKNHRYLMKSLCGIPFKLNGSFVTEALIEIGDICEFGYHKIEFKKSITPDEQVKLFCTYTTENKKVIHSDLPVLIEGETGVGKTSLAREIHELSQRSGRFVHINVSAYSKNLIESELFGHIKGAFTGAMNDKKGAFRLSQGGTLFIDEIDSLPIEIQTKLLLFFDSKKVTPVGSEISYEINTRVICAAGKSLKTMVEKGQMRKDFFFRVASGCTINIPSLRDNTEMIKRFCLLYGIEKSLIIPESLIEFYQTLPWPGNYRQLKGHLDKKFVCMSGRKMDFDEMDNDLVTLSSELVQIEKQHMLTMEELKTNYAKKVYYECGRNLTRASRILKISPRSLRYRIEKELVSSK